ncbi:hypothetical protein [Duganella radicis]|uniref:Uncharacterized protein n=1 Tax=Duganella radicis TaxID=551988 RepID=A0A6L6PBC9_9BURK|nr:hypothetical protein [Duganella radicis]MTV36274.1 hypothetical protein [Duganella radicis]
MSNELDALMMQAGAVDAQIAATAPEAVQAAEEQQVLLSVADENKRGVLLVLGTALPVLGKLYPSLLAVYTDEAQAAIAETVGPLLAKHGIDLKDFGGNYREEIAAALVCGPIAWATVQAVKADIAARAEAPQQPAKPLPAGPAAKPGDIAYRAPEAPPEAGKAVETLGTPAELSGA